jgi:hypothetical protein
MASAPQHATRSAPRPMGAPPTRAATAPNTVSSASAVAVTTPASTLSMCAVRWRSEWRMGWCQEGGAATRWGRAAPEVAPWTSDCTRLK